MKKIMYLDDLDLGDIFKYHDILYEVVERYFDFMVIKNISWDATPYRVTDLHRAVIGNMEAMSPEEIFQWKIQQ